MDENPREDETPDEERGSGKRRTGRTTSGRTSGTSSGRKTGEGRSSGRTAAARSTGNGAAHDEGDRASAMSAIAILRQAREQFEELTGNVPESISALNRTDDGWQMKAEVVELERVPDTMSLLASYTVTLDNNGDVSEYERTRRYTRGRDDPGR